MIKAVLNGGAIQPLEPIPPEWRDGQELRVDDAQPPDDPDSIRRWFEEGERLAADIDPEDFVRLEAALAEADREAKDIVRRQMGLP